MVELDFRGMVLVAGFAFGALACGATSSPSPESTPPETISPPEARTPANPTPAPVAPASPTPAPAAKPACVPYDLQTALKSPGVWALAERVMGEGWLRFQVDASGVAGTVDYVPAKDPVGGIFSCDQRTANFTFDVATRKIALDFGPTCSPFELVVWKETCTPAPAGAAVYTDFAMTDLKYGIESTEGNLFLFPTGHCDPAFTSCAF